MQEQSSLSLLTLISRIIQFTNLSNKKQIQIMHSTENVS